MARKVTDPKNYRLEHAESTLKKSSVAGERMQIRTTSKTNYMSKKRRQIMKGEYSVSKFSEGYLSNRSRSDRLSISNVIRKKLLTETGHIHTR